MTGARPVGEDDPLRRHAARLFVERRQRDLAFASNDDLFGEPAWDLLLDLFVRPLGRELRRIEPGGGWSTQERYVLLLEDRGLIVRSSGRHPDRECVTLSDEAEATMRDYLRRSLRDDANEAA